SSGSVREALLNGVQQLMADDREHLTNSRRLKLWLKSAAKYYWEYHCEADVPS
ncbi:MAG: hypothetical protein GWO10_14630, partial [candidate division Zixibacteria bacterium]|nr:hypothetical protein [candidate division Zixibacteria bacterium]